MQRLDVPGGVLHPFCAMTSTDQVIFISFSAGTWRSVFSCCTPWLAKLQFNLMIDSSRRFDPKQTMTILLPPTEVQTANLRQCFFSNHLERLGSAAFHPEKNIHTSAHLENHVLHDVSNTRDAHMLPHFSTALAIFHRDRTVALSGLCDLSMPALY